MSDTSQTPTKTETETALIDICCFFSMATADVYMKQKDAMADIGRRISYTLPLSAIIPRAAEPYVPVMPWHY